MAQSLNKVHRIAVGCRHDAEVRLLSLGKAAENVVVEGTQTAQQATLQRTTHLAEPLGFEDMGDELAPMDPLKRHGLHFSPI